MTDTTKLQPQTEDESVMMLTEQGVADYLRANPDFFSRQNDWLTEIRIPHHERGTVSLVEIQLKRLRDRISDLERQQMTMLNHATVNSELFDCFAQAQLKLFKSDNIYQVLAIVEQLSQQLNLKVSLRLFNSDDEVLQLDRQMFQAAYRSRLSRDGVYLGRLRQPEAELLYNEPPQLGSFVVLPLGKSADLGVLSFASTDGGHFQPDMDIMFVEQLAAVISQLIEHWAHSREIID